MYFQIVFICAYMFAQKRGITAIQKNPPKLFATRNYYYDYNNFSIDAIDDSGEFILISDRWGDSIWKISDGYCIKDYWLQSPHLGNDYGPQNARKIPLDEEKGFKIEIFNNEFLFFSEPEKKIHYTNSKIEDSADIDGNFQYLFTVYNDEDVIYSFTNNPEQKFDVISNKDGSVIAMFFCDRLGNYSLMCLNTETKKELKINIQLLEGYDDKIQIGSENGNYAYIGYNSNGIIQKICMNDFSIETYKIENWDLSTHFIKQIREINGHLFIAIEDYGTDTVFFYTLENDELKEISSMKFTDWNQDNLYDDDYFDILVGFWNDYEVYFDDSIFAFWSDTLFMSYNYSNQVFLTIHPWELIKDVPMGKITECNIRKINNILYGFFSYQDSDKLYIINLSNMILVKTIQIDYECYLYAIENNCSQFVNISVTDVESCSYVKESILLDLDFNLICNHKWETMVNFPVFFESANCFTAEATDTDKIFLYYIDKNEFYEIDNCKHVFFSGDSVKYSTELVLLKNDYIEIFNLTEKKIVSRYYSSDQFRKSQYFSYFKYLSPLGITFTDIFDNKVSLVWNIISSSEYIIYTPEGFFAGTDWACKNLVYIVDRFEITELNQVYDRLYRPDLIAAKMRGENISEKINFQSILNQGKAPVVSLLDCNSITDDGYYIFNFSVEDTGGGIGYVRYFLNEAPKIAASYNEIEGNKVIYQLKIPLQAGENKIELFASNKAQSIESKHKTVTVKWDGKIEKPNLFVLTLGINKYKIRQKWLDFAVPDAQAVSDAFGNINSTLFENISVFSLLDNEVTKDRITEKFTELSKLIKKDDVFILYLAGHGTTYNADYYYIPVDYYGSRDEQIPEMGISKYNFIDYLSMLDASKILILIDTCGSGGFIDNTTNKELKKTRSILKSDDTDAIRRLKAAVGCSIISACKETQYALEGYEGHGVFTYVLLEALQGNGDLNKDGYISVNELNTYIYDGVYTLTGKLYDYNQETKYEPGVDFPIVKVE